MGPILDVSHSMREEPAEEATIRADFAEVQREAGRIDENRAASP